MDRMDEYNSLLADLEYTPVGLEYSVERGQARLRKAARRQRLIALPLGSLALLAAVFVLMVNIYTPFAVACGRIPLLRELALAAAFSPSLSAAVENEYVQPIEQEQTINDITMAVEYVIVDQKQLNIFYTLDSPIYTQLSASPAISHGDGRELEGYSLGSSTPQIKKGELGLFVVDFVEGEVPSSLRLNCRVHDNGSYSSTNEPPVPVQDSLFQTVWQEPEYIAGFEFTLNFDSSYMQQGEIIPLNHSFALDGQELTISSVEIYPTHMRLNLQDSEENTAWVKSLGLYVENEKGRRFEAISNGISATGSPDSPMMASFRLESAFFSESKSLTLHITGVEWLDKDMERVQVDLANVSATHLPEGVRFEYAERRPGGWKLAFSAPEYEKNHYYQLFGSYYYDEAGNEYMYNVSSRSSYDEAEGRFMEQFGLADYPYDTVYLSPIFSRRVTLPQEVEIRIK